MEFPHEKLQGVRPAQENRSGWVSFGFLIVFLFIIGLAGFSAYLLMELNQIKSNAASAVEARPLVQMSGGRAQANDGSCSKQACEILEKLIQVQNQTAPEKRTKRNFLSSSFINVFAEWLVFTRWGRRTCPQSSQVLTIGSGLGIIVGLHDASGNLLPGSEPVCAPEGADRFKMGSTTEGGQLLPIKFDLDGADFGRDVDQHGFLRCAFCEIRASDQLVVYGSSCPRNWRFMYSGYMVSSSTGSGDSICLDENSSSHQLTNASQEEMRIAKSQRGLSVTCSFCVRHLGDPENIRDVRPEAAGGPGGRGGSIF